MTRIAIVCLALVFTSGCTTVETVRQAVYGTIAEQGNKYCEVRDPAMLSATVTRVNGQLRAAGAEWEVKGEGAIECD